MPQETPLNDFNPFAGRADLVPTKDTHDSNTVGSSLDHFIGTWTQEEADELDAALKYFETVDGIAWTRLTAK